MIKIKLKGVIDGDTFICDIPGLPDVFGKNIRIRLKGINADEMNDLNSYRHNRALTAYSELSNKLKNAKEITISNLERGKYFRLVADVYTDGVHINSYLLNKNLVDKF